MQGVERRGGRGEGIEGIGLGYVSDLYSQRLIIFNSQEACWDEGYEYEGQLTTDIVRY